MPTKVQTLSRKMRARPAAEQPLTSGPSLSASEVNTVVRRLGFVALKVFETIQGNLVSAGRHQYAEALNDSLKPLVDCLVHFDLADGVAPETEKEPYDESL